MADKQKILQVEINSDGSAIDLKDDAFVLKGTVEELAATMKEVTVKLVIPKEFLEYFEAECAETANSPKIPKRVGIAIIVPDEKDEITNAPNEVAHSQSVGTARSVLPKAKDHKGRYCYYDGNGGVECSPPF